MNNYQLEEPLIALFVGVAGTGKSFMAQAVSARLQNSSYLSKDLIQTPFTPTERLTGETYALIKEPTLQILLDFCTLQLKLGKSPVVDAPFSINHTRKDATSLWASRFRQVAEGAGRRLAIIRALPSSLSSLRERIEKRAYAWDKDKLDNWESFLKTEPPDFPIGHDDVLETISEPGGDFLTPVLKYLGAVKAPGKQSS
jgi:predicted kinase